MAFQLPQMDFSPGASGGILGGVAASPTVPAYNLAPSFMPGQVGENGPMSFTDLMRSLGYSRDGNNAAATPFGFNLGTGQMLFSGLGSIGNLLNSFQANQMAGKQFNFTRDLANTNLTNQIKAYNTRLEDRARARAVTEGKDENYVSSYIDKNKLAERRV